ncbi:copper resistance protein B [Tanticharoenia sakaeratensis NBRC 103193]|uniref:Copper resistance protein B n=2 Tax=Tanticharoenia TaxID=444052 RepID=A0A0D6MLS9_9PROT|nr:copper resistance protein B [Tanticharoenia sakaeratensis]GAN54370.1 copper resistance protein B [Tanticharoenia sakaeratensis NBRC 103193]GBQ18804.1 copper resistance protein CopB [Tanticharoenia sakaeratensis NBRC 103193]
MRARILCLALLAPGSVLAQPGAMAGMSESAMSDGAMPNGTMPGMAMDGPPSAPAAQPVKAQTKTRKSTAAPVAKSPAQTASHAVRPASRPVYHAADAQAPDGIVSLGGIPPVMDQMNWFHGILDEFEGRYAPGGSDFRWDGEAWYGGDYNRLWLKSEGTLQRGRLSDGDQEALYSRAISTYFNLQGGVRVDLDSGPTRTWGAFGVQGLALYQFEIQATGYVSDRGRFASRIEGSYDLLLTNRLILQPQAEFNLYTKADPARQVGAGLSDVDAGLRLRYEVWRKFAPYVAVTYAGYLTQARHIVRAQDEQTGAVRFTFGIRSWF